MKPNSPHPVCSPHSWLVAGFALMLLPGTAAQRNTGIIAGRASDREGAVLPRARVTLEPGENTGATNGQGEFTS
jgi:hypothetical protein